MSVDTTYRFVGSSNTIWWNETVTLLGTNIGWYWPIYIADISADMIHLILFDFKLTKQVQVQFQDVNLPNSPNLFPFTSNPFSSPNPAQRRRERFKKGMQGRYWCCKRPHLPSYHWVIQSTKEKYRRWNRWTCNSSNLVNQSQGI